MQKSNSKLKRVFNRYVGVINYRTLISLVISIFATYISYRHNLIFNLDLTLISVGVIFPLVFTLGSAFQRREKALEHLGRAKGALAAIKYLFSFSDKVSPESRNKIYNSVRLVKQELIEFLNAEENDKSKLNEAIDQIEKFISNNRANLGKSLSLKVYRLMRDVVMGIENTIAIKSHRTPHSIRAYCELFIYVFPFFYAPTLIKNIQYPDFVTREIIHTSDLPLLESKYTLIIYGLNIIISFFLITLFNIQEQIENPFDQDGQDDIILENYKLEY